MARRQTTGSTKAPAKSADKAAPAAASATAEQLGNQPADITDNAATIAKAPPGAPVQPVSDATAGLEAGNPGQDAHLIVIWNGLGIAGVAEYVQALQDGGVNVILLKDLDEPLLRHVGQFLQVDQYDVLPPEQLVSIIEAEVGIEPAAATGLQALAATAAASSDAANSSDDSALDDDGDIEGLWITAVPEQGFRRCGFRFTREGFAIALDALTAEQIEQLESEPNLKVERGIFGGRVEVQ